MHLPWQQIFGGAVVVEECVDMHYAAMRDMLSADALPKCEVDLERDMLLVDLPSEDDFMRPVPDLQT